MISLGQYLEFLQTIPYPCITVYEQSRVVLVNRYAEEFFGYSSEELAGRLVDTLLPDLFRDHPFPPVEKARLKAIHLELIAKQRDGSAHAVEIGLSPVVMNGDDFFLVIICKL